MPLPYKPAADSRHRRACLALYRALVRQGRQIRLPNDLLNTTQLQPRNGDTNPITTIINNAFHRNRNITSMRLVSSALKNGYKFLDLLSRARQESTLPTSSSTSETHGPITTTILTFLHQNRTRVTTFLTNRTVQRAATLVLKNPHPHPNAIPLLTLLPPTSENPGPVYVPTNRPLPLSELSGGVRKIPSLDDCAGYPFLRLGMTQSPIKSGMIRSNSRRRQVRAERLVEMRATDVWMGRMEDEWEVLVGALMGEGGQEKPTFDEVLNEMDRKRRLEWRYGRGGKGQQQVDHDNWWTGKEPRDWSQVDELSYEDSWQVSIDELGASLTTQHKHWVAKGKALWKLVVAERELAEEEARERGVKVERRISSHYLDRVKDWRRTWKTRQVKARAEEMFAAEERGDHETARRIAEEKFQVKPPRRPGFRKEDMIRAR